jgi:RNA polymerase sigma-70 factor (sigma-E family)
MPAHQDEADEGFDAFMTERWPHVLRSAYLLTGDRHDAEDLAQAAFVRVCAAWGRVRRADNPEAYLQRVLVNCNHERFRKRRVPEQPVAAVPEGRRVVRDHADVHGERSALMAALADLGPRQRAVIVLRFFEDLTEAQTAGVLGCSVGTVKSQSAKALQRLRAHGQMADFAKSAGVGGASAGTPAGIQATSTSRPEAPRNREGMA